MNKHKYFTILTLLIIIVLFGGCNNNSGTQAILPTPPVSGSDEVTPLPSPGVTPALSQTATPTLSPTVIPTVSPTPVITDESKAKELLQNMTLEEKVGQIFFVRLRKEQALEDITTYHLGGYILFGNDFEGENKTTIKELIDSYQSASSIPMLIGVDEEGGTVNRISKYTAFRAEPFHSPRDLYTEGGFDLIKSDTIEKSKLLLSLGINVNLAPVCDVSTDTSDFIYNRAFGMDAISTSEYIKTVVEVMNKQKLGSTLKHFPGYGNNVDTHNGIAVDERDYNTFINSDFLPFKAGIDAGAGSILVSHNIVTSMDKDYPASLSKEVHNILRNNLGFNGVIMTDDLSMDAIKKYTDDSNAAVLAIEAGNDLIIASNFIEQIPAVIDAVNNNTISIDRIDESVLKVLMWKLSLGIIKE
jgi:beta-N-acetylhexosaminidase